MVSDCHGTRDLSPNDVAAIRWAVNEIEGRASQRGGRTLYMASPYSHVDARVREERFEAACHAAAMITRDGQIVFSPVVHSHPIARHGLPTDWAFWERFDRQLLEMCDEVIVLTLPGWRESTGVKAEIRIARELGKPIRFLDSATSPTGGKSSSTGAG